MRKDEDLKQTMQKRETGQPEKDKIKKRENNKIDPEMTFSKTVLVSRNFNSKLLRLPEMNRKFQKNPKDLALRNIIEKNLNLGVCRMNMITNKSTMMAFQKDQRY